MKLKKILALVLACVMVLGMTGAMAATTNHETNDVGKDIAVYNGSDTFTGYTSITYKVWLNDKKNAAINRPKTAFEYTITTGVAVADDGVAQGDLSWISFSNSDMNVNTIKTTAFNAANNNTDYDTITVYFNIPNTVGAGIYRYVITQKEMSTAQQTLGIKNENNTYAAVAKNLDVYIDAKHHVNGAVLFNTIDNDNFVTTSAAGGEANNDYNSKTDGWHNVIGDNDDPDPNDPTNPTIPTNTVGQDVTITKTVAGNMGSTTEDFEFSLKLTNTLTGDTDTSLEGFTVHFTSDNAYMSSNNVNLAATGTATSPITFKLKANETFTITGIPATVKVEVKENTAESEGYLISSTVDDTKLSDIAKVGEFATPENSTVRTEGTTYTTRGTVIIDKDGVIDYVNYRNNISPTGVVLRFAPYIAMLVAGTALFLILLAKRREEDKEEN